MIMKRILLFTVLLFATLSLIGQNVWKYPVYANGGIIVGAGQNITTPSIVLGSTAITATAAQLNVVYSDRLKWDGGSTGLTAATGRSSLGGTTVGQALFTLTNPSAITFLRVNANNTVTALSATDFRTAIGAGTVGTNLFAANGTGSVTFIRVNADNSVSLQSAANFRTALSLNSVTNESKATMFTSPTFTGDLPKYSTTDTLATQSYARTYGGSGTVTISDVQEEIADSLDTLRPLVVAVADTSDMLDPYITDHEARKAINDTLTARLNGATEISDIVVMLADSTGGGGHYASHYDMTTGLAGKVAVSDTALMLTPYITDADARKAINDSLTARLNGATELSSVASMLADIKPYFVFGAGSGADADSTLFAKGAKAFGSFRVIEDSLYTYSFTNLYMSSGDSIKMNVYIGNGMTRVATDSLFTAPQGVGSHFATLTPNNVRTIPKDKDVWVGIIGPQPVGQRPKEWVFQLNAKIVRD